MAAVCAHRGRHPRSPCMNDANFALVQKVVERCLQSFRTSIAHKTQLSEELLAHLLGVFEAEYSKHGDESMAIQEALRRFGDPAALADDIRASTTVVGHA